MTTIEVKSLVLAQNFVSRHIACIIQSQPWSIARDLSPDDWGCDDGHALAGVKLGGILNVENSVINMGFKKSSQRRDLLGLVVKPLDKQALWVRFP